MRFDREVRVKLRELFSARHEPEAYRLLATAYWYMLLLVTTLLVVAGIGYGAWEFMTPTGGADVNAVKPQSTLSKQQLQTLIRKFEERAQQFEQRRAAPASVKDPS